MHQGTYTRIYVYTYTSVCQDRGKLKKRRARVDEELSAGESSDDGLESPKKTAAQVGDEPPVEEDSFVRKFHQGSSISLVDGAGNAVAHGAIVDDEPELDVTLAEEAMDMIATHFQKGSWWKVVQLTSVAGKRSSSLEIEKDHVFGPHGEVLNATQRRIANLVGLDSIVIWHDWVRARVRAIKQPSKRPAKKKKR